MGRRVGYWAVVVAGELVVATVVGGMALAVVSGVATVPESLMVAERVPVVASMVEAQRAAFVKAFAAVMAFFAFVHLFGYLAFSVKPGARIGLDGLFGTRGRQRFVSFVFLAAFVAAWASVWLDTWTQDVAPRVAAALPLAWLTVVFAGVTALASWRASPSWRIECIWLASGALLLAGGVAACNGTAWLTIASSVVALSWLSFDGALRAPVSAS